MAVTPVKVLAFEIAKVPVLDLVMPVVPVIADPEKV